MKYGLISDPIVQIIDIDMIRSVSEHSQLFAVSATDGLLQYVSTKEIGEIMAKAMYFSHGDSRDVSAEDENEKGLQEEYHITTAAEELIQRAAHGWYEDEGASYRDDIAIAAMKIF